MVNGNCRVGQLGKFLRVRPAVELGEHDAVGIDGVDYLVVENEAVLTRNRPNRFDDSEDIYYLPLF